MFTLEWMPTVNHEFERDRSYLIKWGRLLSNFSSYNTKVAFLESQGNWLVEGECVKPPDYVFPINSTNHKTIPEEFSIGDKVHITDPRVQHWTGTIIAIRNLPGMWIVRNDSGFGVDVEERYLIKATPRVNEE